MVYGIFLLLITGFISFYLINFLAHRHVNFNSKLMKQMYFVHLFMSVVYYVYALFNPSDSNFYYEKVIIDYRGPNWADFYGTSTTFVEWVSYPFIRYMDFSYEAVMVLFSFMGFLGFLYFYLFVKENIKFKHTLFGVDLISIMFLLPNLHFWSGSLGKGSIIFMGIGLFYFAFTRPAKRWVALIIGSLIIYHVRPHIMFVILASALIGFTFSSKGLSIATRVAMIIVAVVAFSFIYNDVLTMVGIEGADDADQGLALDVRAEELTKATSGVDISSYSLPLQLFTFLYRPLFFDAPGILGLVVSIENLFYLIITLKILNPRGIRFIINGNFLVKTAFFSFITVAIALAQISGNLGLAIRQKSQVIPLFLFVVIAFLDSEKLLAYRKSLQFKRFRQRQLKKRLRQQSTGDQLAASN